MAGGLVDPSWRAVEAISIRVNLRALSGAALELSFEALRVDGPLRRTLEVMSCSEARRATAVWIALSVGEQSPTEGTAEPVAPAIEPEPEPEPVPVATPEAQAPPADAEPKADVSTAPLEVEEPPPAVRPEPKARAPTTFKRDGFSLAIAAGVEGPVLTSVGVPIAAWVGWRAKHLEVDLGASVWLPTQDEVSGVDVRLDQVGAVLGACYWLSFERWELGPSAKLLIERVDAELSGQDAEAKGWVRAALGMRLALWLSRHVSFQLVTDAIVSLHRPTLSTSAGDTVRTTAFNVAALGALVWSP